MDIDELEKLIGLIKGSDIAEFELERDGTNIRVLRNVGGAVGIGTTAPVIKPAIVESAVADVEESAPVQHSDDLTVVECPIVGTFYRKPSPDAEPFVEVGTTVKKGDTLCIVEAMKLMNEVPSPASGVIEQILVQDGDVVEFGEALFLIRPS